jgi:hypothetical protein
VSPDALIPIFVVEIETKTPGIGEVTVSGWWTESFGSLDALNAFLTGFRCATIRCSDRCTDNGCRLVVSAHTY